MSTIQICPHCLHPGGWEWWQRDRERVSSGKALSKPAQLPRTMLLSANADPDGFFAPQNPACFSPSPLSAPHTVSAVHPLSDFFHRRGGTGRREYNTNHSIFYPQSTRVGEITPRTEGWKGDTRLLEIGCPSHPALSLSEGWKGSRRPLPGPD